MNRKYKRTIWGFSKLDCDAITRYLARMAKKGWLIVKIEDRSAVFKAAAPGNYSFGIDINDDFGIGMSKGELAVNKRFAEYVELCRESGWQYLCSWGYLHIFSSDEGKEPVPLQTDKDMEERNIFNKLWRGEVFKHLGMLTLWLAMALQMLYLWFDGGKPNIQTLKNDGFLINAAMILFYLIPTAFMFIYTLQWYRKSRLHIRYFGEPARTSVKSARIRAVAHVVLTAAYLILLWSLLLHSSIKDGTLADSLYTRLVICAVPAAVIISVVVNFRYPLIFNSDSDYSRKERAIVIIIISLISILYLFVVAQLCQ